MRLAPFDHAAEQFRVYCLVRQLFREIASLEDRAPLRLPAARRLHPPVAAAAGRTGAPCPPHASRCPVPGVDWQTDQLEVWCMIAEELVDQLSSEHVQRVAQIAEPLARCDERTQLFGL